MNLIISIFGISIIAAVICQLLKSKWPEMASVLNIGTAVVIMLAVLSNLGHIINFITDLSSSIKLDSGYLEKILSVLCISLLIRMLMAILHDMNNEALSFAADFAGRVCILVIILPVVMDAIKALLDLIG